MAPPCPECQKFREQSTNPALDPNARQTAEDNLIAHQKFVNDHLNVLNGERAYLNKNKSALVFG